VSRLSREKGLDVLLRALARIRASGADATLRIAGDGPERERLAALVADLGVGAFVSFLGAQRDTASLYRSCDVFVQPSREEACSLSVLEAMAAGAPVVATAVGGTPELARDELDALLVPCDDPALLAGAVVALLEDRARAAALGASARRRVLARFTLDRMIGETIAVYDALRSQATTPPTRR
jgi:glycosyltransferase involved in cell wall biosynthesis